MNRYLSTLLLRFCLLIILALTSMGAQADQQEDAALGPLLKKALAGGKCFDDKFDRAVWFAAMDPRLKRIISDTDERTLILEQVQCEAKRLQLPPSLVMAVIDVESRFNRVAVSSAGAVGLMQVMPFWPKQLGMQNHQLLEIPHNIRMGCTILKYYLDRERGDYARALARYNGSLGRRNYSDLVLVRLANRWQFK
ncbi:MAG: transglycosylase SLT domain-containing protein [Steroidobacteraceae bacterium]